jgi:hypothetical protein
VRANPLVLDQLDFMNDFRAAGTFLKKAFWNATATASSAAATSWGFFENSHDFMRARR